jgi:hypothetical protein
MIIEGGESIGWIGERREEKRGERRREECFKEEH